MNRETPSIRHVFRLLRIAETGVAALTRPETDLAASDARFAQLWRETTFARAWGWQSSTTGRAWSESRLKFMLDPFVDGVRRAPPAVLIRMIGWVIALAATIALTLQALEPTPVGPLSWLVPTSSMAVGIVLMAGATSLATSRRDRVS
jgi:hypothetical protein